jgi:hypothetical protein
MRGVQGYRWGRCVRWSWGAALSVKGRRGMRKDVVMFDEAKYSARCPILLKTALYVERAVQL